MSASDPPDDSAGAALTRGFLFCDLRGYTAYVEAHGDRAAAEYLGEYRALVRGALGATGGGEIRTEGDSFYLVFRSASAAVRCGLAIVDAAAAASADRAEGPISVGVGIHAGESVEEGEGYVGSAVNIAARVCAVAGPGEVLVTDTVRSLVRTSLAVTFRSRGRPRLKGIAEPIDLFAVTPAAAAVPVTVGRPGRLSGSLHRSRSLLVAGGLVALVAIAVPLVALLLQGASPGPSPSASSLTSGGAPASGGSIDLTLLPGRIVYRGSHRLAGESEPVRQVFVSKPDGAARPVQLTPLTDDVLEFAARPDGAAIVYLTAREELQVADLDGARSPERWPGVWGLAGFYKGAPLRPAELYGWLPSGELLLEPGPDAGNPRNAAARLSANGRSLVPIPVNGCAGAELATGDDLAPSPDGSLVAFRSGTDLWIAPRDRCPIQLTDEVDASQPAWSPDGSRIAFRATATGGATDIWIVDANGSGLLQLTTDSEEDAQPTWSPDGAWIAWSRGGGDTSKLWVMRADGTASTQIPIGDVAEQLDSPVWLPIGSTASPSPTIAVPNPFEVVASYGAAQLGLDQPIAIAIGPDGNVYITDRSPSVTVVTAFGAHVTSWGGQGAGPGQFDFVAGENYHGSIAVGPDGRVYVSDSHNSRVQVFEATGKFVRQFGTRGTQDGEFMDPFDLGVDAAGNVYVLDDVNLNLQKFSPTGGPLWKLDHSTLPDMTGHGHGANLDPAGRIVIGNDDTGQVLYLDPAGQEKDAFDGRACDVTLDAAGDAYVGGCGGDTIEVFDPAHRLIGRWSGPTMPLDGPPEFGPEGEIFALGKDGSLIRLRVTLAG